MKICAVSDTHCSLGEFDLPEADLLIHSGDLTYRGSFLEMSKELLILGNQRKKYKYGIIFICGNHDWLGEKDPGMTRLLCKQNDIIYLENESVTIEGLNFYGSPVQPWFHDWAFNKHRGQEIKKYWDAIPENTDVLITHGPPYGIGDYCDNGYVGCVDLLEAIKRINPKLHFYGHIHDEHGVREAYNTKFINASVMNDFYNPVYEPILVEI